MTNPQYDGNNIYKYHQYEGKTMDYITINELKSEDLKSIRKMTNMSQREFAELLNISKPTMERWESGKAKISGPAVPLLTLIKQNPDIIRNLELPKNELKVRLYYMNGNTVCTVIDVDDMLQKVRIRNYTDNLLYRAFGRNEHPTYKDYEEFLESRCFPAGRDKMKIMLKQYDLPFYDPFLIIEKTEGRMAEDDFWIKIER